MDGQLGCESVMRCFSPHLIETCAINIIQVAAGGKHTLLLKATGQIIAFGKGDKGQLGQGSYSSSSIPVTINPPSGGSWKQIAAGGEHSLAIFESADNRSTQLYCPLINLGLVQIFTPFKAFPRECHLILGRYAWGCNEFSNTADAQSTDSSNKICSPVSKSFFYAEHSSEGGKDAAVHVVAVAAGAKHSAALDVKGKLYMWGCNEKSQCGNGALWIQMQMLSLPSSGSAVQLCW